MLRIGEDSTKQIYVLHLISDNIIYTFIVKINMAFNIKVLYLVNV